MKRLTCDICGSVDLIKTDGLFQCQNCGTRYTVEEARRMAAEDAVEVQSNVPANLSAYLSNCLENARQTKEQGDWERTARYYDMVQEMAPACLEAILYSTYARAMLSLQDLSLVKRENAFQVLCRGITLFYESMDSYDIEELLELANCYADDLIDLFGSAFVYNQRTNGYGMVTASDIGATYKLFYETAQHFCRVTDAIVEQAPHFGFCLCGFGLAIRFHLLAKDLKVDKMIQVGYGLVNQERKLLFTHFPDSAQLYRTRKAGLIAEAKSYQTDLRSFAPYGETVKLNREVATLTEVLNTRKLTPTEKKALKDQIARTKERQSAAAAALHQARKQRVDDLREELRYINIILGITTPPEI